MTIQKHLEKWGVNTTGGEAMSLEQARVYPGLKDWRLENKKTELSLCF
jgi:hypothetical protein